HVGARPTRYCAQRLGWAKRKQCCGYGEECAKNDQPAPRRTNELFHASIKPRLGTACQRSSPRLIVSGFGTFRITVFSHAAHCSAPRLRPGETRLVVETPLTNSHSWSLGRPNSVVMIGGKIYKK